MSALTFLGMLAPLVVAVALVVLAASLAYGGMAALGRLARSVKNEFDPYLQIGDD